MIVRAEFKKPQGVVDIIASKSFAHRLLICAALAESSCDIRCNAPVSEDISATVRCLDSLGAKTEKCGEILSVSPIDEPRSCELFCGESGSTLRFLIPVAAALGKTVTFTGEGRLPTRPCLPLVECLRERGAKIDYDGKLPLVTHGGLSAGRFDIAGDISSQFISGLIFALPLLHGDSEIHISGKIESLRYIHMTLECISRFGIKTTFEENVIKIPGDQKYISPKLAEAEGDWSNAAFWLCLGALSEEGITVRGLNENSIQGDRRIIDILKEFGASVETREGGITVKKKGLRGIRVDASEIPDLVPIVSVLASVACGETVIYNAARLRFKESDRIESTVAMLRNLGADATAETDSIKIVGKPNLTGGIVDSCNDHRIAMSAAIAAAAGEGIVEIHDAEAVRKSYGDFYDILQNVGAKVEKEEERDYGIVNRK